MMSSYRPYIIFCLTFLASVSFGKTTAQYLPPGAVDGIAIVGPPPKADSAEQAEDMAIVLWIQKTRTPEQIRMAQDGVILNLDNFTDALALELTNVNGALLKKTLDDVFVEVRADYNALKKHFNRQRPYTVNPKVHPCIQKEPSTSYPSGHTTRGLVYAYLLADIFPHKKAELFELGYQEGYNRVVGGVHFPSDVRAGEKLGKAYAEAILAQPAWKKATEVIKAGQPAKASSLEEKM
ncbi:phosphatase PAP2 family protein [Rubellicoccus peritrichatus]|uniref:Acid phosphatase n=1 Tax=Rubellicoccus peritrichatus TaxID=3080537 RepID=A0AAQ3L8C6_9BACT|nr:phosphatase PAP2 family protein [Puniceicoccus sp. CR14]WOO40971.1 phosphatase PAP2 family protein [Puniceicoccus sp. CR14]